MCGQISCCCPPMMDPCCDPCGPQGYPYGYGNCNTPQFGAPCFNPVYRQKTGFATETVIFSPNAASTIVAGTGVSPPNPFVTIASSGLCGDTTVTSIVPTFTTPPTTGPLTALSVTINQSIVACSPCKVEMTVLYEHANPATPSSYYKSEPVNLMSCGTSATINMPLTAVSPVIAAVAGDKLTIFLKYVTR